LFFKACIAKKRFYSGCEKLQVPSRLWELYKFLRARASWAPPSGEFRSGPFTILKLTLRTLHDVLHEIWNNYGRKDESVFNGESASFYLIEA
jgi:hypothetical protein